MSFYWGEADDAPGGWVPAALTRQLTPHLRYMAGTSQAAPRCEQLVGEIPGALCAIYENRPSPCRELEPYAEDGRVSPQCARARARHGLPPLPELQPLPGQVPVLDPLEENVVAASALLVDVGAAVNDLPSWPEDDPGAEVA